MKYSFMTPISKIYAYHVGLISKTSTTVTITTRNFIECISLTQLNATTEKAVQFSTSMNACL